MRSPVTEKFTVPTYTKIEIVVADIRHRIESGRLRPGDKLPSGAEMRAQYGVSQMTIRIAIERLRAAGFVVTVPGSGIYVAAGPF